GGGDFVSSPKSNEAPQTPAVTAAGGAEDSAALTDLSLKLDRRTSPTRRRLRKPFTSSASDHFPENIFAVEDTLPAGEGILATAPTIPTGSTTISAGSSMDTVAHATAAPSSTIPAADKGKAPMLGEELAKKLHAKQEAEFARQQEELVKALSLSQLKHEFEYIQRTLERSNLQNFKRTTFRPAPSLEAPFAKRARHEVPRDVHDASSQVLASVPAVPTVAVAVFVLVAPSVAANVSVPAVSPTHAAVSIPVDTEVHTDESCLDYPHTASEHVSTEPTVDETTPSSSRTRRKHLAKKRVTPIVDIADDALIKFDIASDSDGNPLPYAPYAGWEMVPSPLGSIHAYYDIEGHTKHFTSLRELLHVVEKNDLRRLLGVVDNLYQREEPDTFAFLFWRLYPCAQVHVLETVDGRVIYMFVDVSYPLSAATLQCMLKHGLEAPKLLVGGDLTMAEQLIVPAGRYVVPAGRLSSHSCCWVSAGKYSFCC
nr:hypothetical protein [Tanacetum cinerariifolium]